MTIDVAALTIDVCICTFRRPHLEQTLWSLEGLRIPPHTTVKIIVADNDDSPSAAALVERVSSSHSLGISYLHAPARNISIARNACLDATSADFAAFVDDDETVSADWLLLLLEAVKSQRADIVLGPVRAIYGHAAPNWMKEGNFHSTMPVFVSGTIRTGYTCNVLMDLASPHVAGRRFDIARGQTGGEDTAMFTAIFEGGGIIGFAPNAWIEEVVPPERATFTWLAKRRFRVGQTHGRLMAQHGPLVRLKSLLLGFCKVCFCLSSALLTAPFAMVRNKNILRGTMHLGVVSGLLNREELRLYGLEGSEIGRQVA